MSKLNNKPKSGTDEISNILLKNALMEIKMQILKLFNQTITQSKIPSIWKVANNTMIPKKTCDLETPNTIAK